MTSLLLKHYFDGGFGIPTAAPNIYFDPADESTWQGYKGDVRIWAEFYNMPSSANKATFKNNRNYGILQISLYAPLNANTSALEAKAREIVAYYGIEQSHPLDDKSRLYSMSAFAGQILPSEAFIMLPVTINYHIIN